MSIFIYNTLTRKKELFQTIEPGKVLMYVCGPTVYDACHIGHARSAVVFDVISRYLKSQGYDVVYVRNFTDIDDKIIHRAAEIGMDPKALADKYIAEFYRDMDDLRVERASFEPRVTDHIDDVIQLVEKLLAKRVAYHVDGDVFFAVETFDAYGKLSNRRLEDMDPGARVEVDPRKRNPFDFILWKSAKPGEPSWASPWGNGRPGWHIECSAMSARYLGRTFDIHGGGRDLIFPHHENEIAQSEAGHERKFVRYWIHNGFVNIDKEKMSKSLGNFRMIKDVIQEYHPEVIRLFLLSKQYRKPIDFNQTSMEASRTALDRIYALLLRIDETIAGTEIPSETQAGTPFWKLFCQAMDDDFNTANGIAVIFNAVRHANRIMDENEIGTMQREVLISLSVVKDEILRMGAVLGIGGDVPAAYFHAHRRSILAQETMDAAVIEKLIADRELARQKKDWKSADQIREQLASMNIVLKDHPDGTHWEIKS
jgi:cysteinyl-tRNA synthetase